MVQAASFQIREVGGRAKVVELERNLERVFRLFRLTPMLLAIVLYYAYVMEHTGSGPEWNIIEKNANLCKKTGWMNLLYAQIALPFEDQVKNFYRETCVIKFLKKKLYIYIFMYFI